MYLHIGNDIILKKKNILFILDYKNLNDSNLFQDFLSKIDKKNIVDISEGKPKSIVITKENEVVKGYISNISSTTLGRRKFL